MVNAQQAKRVSHQPTNPTPDLEPLLPSDTCTAFDSKPGYTEGPPGASLGRFLCDLVQGACRPPKPPSRPPPPLTKVRNVAGLD